MRFVPFATAKKTFLGTPTRLAPSFRRKTAAKEIDRFVAVILCQTGREKCGISSLGTI